jgi:hypothetical protein
VAARTLADAEAFMSDIDITPSSSRTDQAKDLLGKAGETIKAEAQSFASVAQDRVKAEAQKGAQTAGKTLGDFATAIRRAGDELASADQSPASRLVGHAAEGLEGLSRNLADKDPGELLNAVRDFGRKNPVAFIGGALLVGVALGRFVRASDTAGVSKLRDETLTFAEEDTFDGPSEADFAAGLDGSIGSNLGDLSAPDEADALGVDDGTSGVGDDDATAFSNEPGR